MKFRQVAILINKNLLNTGFKNADRKLFTSPVLKQQENSSKPIESEEATENVNEGKTLLDKYHQLVKTNILNYDSHQFEAVIRLNYFHNRINYYKAEPLENANSKTVLTNLLKRYFKKTNNEDDQTNRPIPRIKSIYLYGGVGCGKTMLMDLVYTMLPEESLKERIHFNKFMLNIHQNVHEIKRDKRYKYDDPLSVLCDKIIKKVNLLFFDEFQVTDIADAMLMSRLFTSLFERGMIVFFTSNRVPNDLYKNGLQRELFMPFIDVIYHYCDVVNLDSPIDYRKKAHISAHNRIYFNCDYETHLLDKLVRNLIKKQDVDLQSSTDANNDELNKLQTKEIEVLGRRITLNKTYKRLLDTNFSFMCEEARSSVDYLEFCRLYDVIILRDIPFINIKHFDVLRRFILLIDAIYDNKVKFVCSGKASSPLLLFDLSSNNLNAVHDEHFALERTISRLIDMQSENYIDVTSKRNK